MDATQAIDYLDPQKWEKTSVQERLDLLKRVLQNLGPHIEKFAASDSNMKKIPAEGDQYRYLNALGYQATIVPMGTLIAACIDLYESLIAGKMLGPLSIKKVADDLYDIHVFPQAMKDKLMYIGRKDYLRVRGEPKQINPLTREGGIIAVLGAGNYSSPVEVINALFLANCAVVHKPHPLNAKTDKIWEQVLQPLVAHQALSFCEADQGPDLVKDKRLKYVYFTGGSSNAKAIMASTDVEVISECGGNNPCVVVPGDVPWTEKQIEHQVLQIATMAKINGGAVCGRPQTIVTCKHWPQRAEFMRALGKALEHGTPAAQNYYPGSDSVLAAFKANHPEAQVIVPEGGRIDNAEVLLIEDVAADSYAVKNEAFCQVLNEVALDTPAAAEVFLEKAVEFCNTELWGTLGCTILIDDQTQKNHQLAVEETVTAMKYGAVGVNTMPPMVFMNPYLSWGGNEEGEALASGHGNFGNLLCFENVEKSIVYSSFMSVGHMMSTNKQVWYDMSKRAARFAATPSWMNLMSTAWVMLTAGGKDKDF